jgi:cytochrome c-type biogenesis protein
MKSVLWTLFFVALVALAVPVLAQAPPGKNFSQIADVTLTADSGQKIRLGDYRGKIVFINFWGAWCPPCGQEMPSIRTMQSSLQDRGNDIVFIFISALHDWFDRDNARFKEYGMAGHNYDWTNRTTEKWEFFMGPGAGTFHFRSPTTFVFNRTGDIAFLRVNQAVPWEIHTNEIRALLN